MSQPMCLCGWRESEVQDTEVVNRIWIGKRKKGDNDKQ